MLALKRLEFTQKIYLRKSIFLNIHECDGKKNAKSRYLIVSEFFFVRCRRTYVHKNSLSDL